MKSQSGGLLQRIQAFGSSVLPYVLLPYVRRTYLTRGGRKEKEERERVFFGDWESLLPSFLFSVCGCRMLSDAPAGLESRVWRRTARQDSL